MELGISGGEEGGCHALRGESPGGGKGGGMSRSGGEESLAASRPARVASLSVSLRDLGA
jgi:hypothetical protein